MPQDLQRQTRHVQPRALMIGAATAVLIYVALLAAYSPTEFPTVMVSQSHWPSLMDKPVGEDGYYMLTVADNIATKGQILYNRGVQATGIQPLATVLFALVDCAVRAFGGGAIALIRSVMVFGALLFLVLAFQLSRIAAALAPERLRPHAAALAFLLTLFDFTLFRLFTYGLETGIYLVLVAACFQITLRISANGKTRTRDMVALGLAAGCAGEARIDFGLLFAAVLAMLLLYRLASWMQAMGAGLIALLLVSPWFWFVHRVSGSWLPSSGKAESTMISGAVVAKRVGTLVVAVAGELMPWCYAVTSHVTVVLVLLSTVSVALLLVLRKDVRDVVIGTVFSRPGMVWLPGLIALAAVYFLLFNATHFYYRYMAPLAVIAAPACAVMLSQVGVIRRHMLAVTSLLCVAFASWAAGSLHTGHLGNSQTIAAGYVHENFPRAHVGSFQSGVIGYFNRNVENLDGKLNQGALEATAKHQLPAFIDSEHIDVLVDWPSVVHANLPAAYLQEEWMPCPVPLSGHSESICLLRKSATVQSTDKPQA